MVRHIVAWNYREDLSLEQRKTVGEDMKRELENLIHLIDGIETIQVYLNPLDTSDSDILLDSIFESEEALKSYITHPEHVRVGSNFVRPNVINRKCIDVYM